MLPCLSKVDIQMTPEPLRGRPGMRDRIVISPSGRCWMRGLLAILTLFTLTACTNGDLRSVSTSCRDARATPCRLDLLVPFAHELVLTRGKTPSVASEELCAQSPGSVIEWILLVEGPWEPSSDEHVVMTTVASASLMFDGGTIAEPLAHPTLVESCPLAVINDNPALVEPPRVKYQYDCDRAARWGSAAPPLPTANYNLDGSDPSHDELRLIRRAGT